MTWPAVVPPSHSLERMPPRPVAPPAPAAPLTFGSLFAGVGGLDLGLERAGLRCRWQVEIDAWCRGVLARHWPDVPKFADVREVGAAQLGHVDVIAGGFPCQDISTAGRRAGIEGARSGLWSEYIRIVRELRPRYVLVENVGALRHRGGGIYRVLGDLAACGYDAQWDMLPAATFGTPHLRERMFIVAYPCSERWHDGDGAQLFEGIVRAKHSQWPPNSGLANFTFNGRAYSGIPESVRMDDGLPGGAHRVKACGNAVVPQVAEHVARRIIAHHGQLPAPPGYVVH